MDKQPPDIDLILSALVTNVTLSDDKNAQCGITLTLPSGFVTGTMIPATVWMDEMQENLGTNGEGTLAGMFAELSDYAGQARSQWREASKVAENLPDFYREAVEKAGPQIDYVHLRDARFPFPSGDGLTPGTHWRGRVDQVIGWSLGVFSTTRR